MRRGIAIAAIVALGLGLALLSGLGPAKRALESKVGSILSHALPEGLAFDAISIAGMPPRLTVTRPRVQRGDVVLASADVVTIRWAAGASIWEGAWFLDVAVVSPRAEVDVADRWWEHLAGGGSGETRVKLRRVVVTSGTASVRVDAGTTVRIADAFVETQAGGLLAARIEFDGRAKGAVERAGRAFVLDEIAVRGDLRGRRLAIEAATVRGEGSTVGASGTIDRGEWEGTIESTLRIDPILALAPEAGSIGGAGRVSARISGTLDSPRIDADLDVEALRIDRLELAGRSALRIAGREWELGPAEVKIFGGVAAGTARGSVAPEVPYELRATLRGWDPAKFLAMLDVRAPIRGEVSGEGTMRGRLLAEEMEGDARFDVRAEGRGATGEAKFRVSPALDVVDLAMRLPGGGDLRARDEIAGHRHEGRLTARAVDLAMIAPFLGAALAGVVEGEASIRSEHGEPAVDGTATIRDLAIRDLRLGTLAGPFVLTPSSLASPGLEARDLRARASGRWSFGGPSLGDARIELADAPIDRWSALARAWRPDLPDASGRMSGRMTLAGAREHPDLATIVEAKELVVAGESLGEMKTTVEGKAGAIDVRASIHGGGDDEAVITVAKDSRGTLRGGVRVAKWRLDEIAALRRGTADVNGTVTLDADVAGSIDEPRLSGIAELRELAVAGAELGTVDAKIRADARSVSIEARGAEGSSVVVEGAMDWPHRFRAHASWTDLEVVPGQDRGKRIVVASTGNLDLEGDAERPIGRGNAHIERLRIAHPSGAMTNPRPWTVRIADGTVTLDPQELTGDGQRLVLSGRASGPAYQARAVGEASLSLAEGWVPGLVSSRGRLEIDVTASGSAGEAPRLRGTARVAEAAADVGVLVGLTNVTGAVEFRDDEVMVRDFAGAVGGGTFAVDGAFSRARGFGLRWKLERASLGAPEWLEHRITGEGRLDGPIGAPLLAGAIRVDQAIYDQNVEWGEFLPWVRRRAKLPQSRLELPLRFDLHVVADDGLFVDNNLAKIELSTNLHVSGELERPALAGRFEVLDGKISFRERVFELTSGELRFEEARPFDPSLDVRGESRVRTQDDEIEIDLHVSGTAESPRIEFTSDDPSLSQNDLIALVTFGRTAAQLQTGEAGVSLDELLAIAGGGRANRLESDIHRVLPVDRIEIESAFSRTTGTTEPRVRIGKDLSPSIRSTPLGKTLRGPMRASLGSSLGTGRDRDVTLEYGLTRSISLEGLWESQTESGAGAFGADVKFRLPFWGLRFSLLPAGWRSRDEPDDGSP